MAIIGIVALLINGSLTWQDIEEKSNWGVLILFGGGLCLGAAIDKTGTAAYLANEIILLFASWPSWLLLVLLMLFIVFMTEFMSNTACAALMVPLFIGMSQHLHFSPVALAAMVGIATNCAFMLPIATPPNALVYATKQVPQRDMIKVGFCLNLIFTAILVVLAKWLNSSL